MQVLPQALQGEMLKQVKAPVTDVMVDIEVTSDFAMLFTEDALDPSAGLEEAVLPIAIPEEQLPPEGIESSAADTAQGSLEVAEPVIAAVEPASKKLAEGEQPPELSSASQVQQIATTVDAAEPKVVADAPFRMPNPESGSDVQLPETEQAFTAVPKTISDSVDPAREVALVQPARGKEPLETTKLFPMASEARVAAERDLSSLVEAKRSAAPPDLQVTRANTDNRPVALPKGAFKNDGPAPAVTGPVVSAPSAESSVTEMVARSVDTVPSAMPVAAEPTVSTEERPRRTRGTEVDLRTPVAALGSERSLPAATTILQASPTQQPQVLQAKPEFAIIKEQSLPATETSLDVLLQAERIETERTLPKDVGRVEPTVRSVVAQVVNTITRVYADGIVELRLQPEELGRVRMTMLQSDMGIVVQISAERPETLDLMRRNIDMLEADLADRGFSDLSFSFEQEADQHSRHAGGDQDLSDQTHGQDMPNERIDVVQNHITGVEGRIDIRL